MGCFSFICKESEQPVCSSSSDGDAVYLFLLKDGKVIEEMYGNYDSYGRVFSNSNLDDSFEWEMDWDDVVNLIFDDNKSNGIAAVLASEFTGDVPTTRSEDDPNQGWEPMLYNFRVKEPYHKVY